MKSSVPEPRPEPRIAVLIPYFQRNAGLLHRALSSVAAQEHKPVQVVIVDDGSPHGACEELTPALRTALPGLTLIRQNNQGISAARNAGLDALVADATAVALLDSDDYWERSHLSYAATALSLGADFFFSNSRIEDQTMDYFRMYPRPGNVHTVPLALRTTDYLRMYPHPGNVQTVPGAPGIMRWSDSLSLLWGDGFAFSTPTVVFQRAVMPEIRFPVNFRCAGEDQFAFWELLVRSSVIMFCTEPTVVVGLGGVGTWRNSTLGSVTNLVRLADEIRLQRHAIRIYPVNADERCLTRDSISGRRQAALSSALHLLRRRRKGAVSEVLYLLRSDPMCTAHWCADFPKLLYRWIRGHLLGQART